MTVATAARINTRATSRWCRALGRSLGLAALLAVYLVALNWPPGTRRFGRYDLAAAAAVATLLLITGFGAWMSARSSAHGLRWVLRKASADALPRSRKSAILAAIFMAAPVIAFVTPVVWDPDSTRFLASILYVQRTGTKFLFDTQDVFLPYILVGPLIKLGGIAAAKYLVATSLVLLVGLVAWIVWDLTGVGVAALAGSAAILGVKVLLDQLGAVRLYPLALFFGYLAAFLMKRCLDRPDRRVTTPLVLSVALVLVLAYESHGIGQLFMMVPAIMLILRPTARALKRVLRVYGATLVLMIPRLIVNLSVGGLADFRRNRTDYFILNGYMRLINQNFWGYPGTKVSARTFLLGLLQKMFELVHPVTWFIVAILVVAAFLSASRRSQVFAACVFAVFFAALVIARPPLHARYFLPLVPAAGIAIGVGVAALISRSPRAEHGRSRWGRPRATLAVAATFFLVCVAALGVASYRNWSEANTWAVEEGPFKAMASMVGDSPHPGVIGVRSNYLLFDSLKPQPYGTLFLSESEFVTYLTWPSDAAVAEVAARHNIGWAFVLPSLSLETDYHDAWLVPTYGKRAVQVERLESSPFACLAMEKDGYRLYGLGDTCKEGSFG